MLFGFKMDRSLKIEKPKEFAKMLLFVGTSI